MAAPARGQEAQLAWERRAGRVAGPVAFLSLALLIAAGFFGRLPRAADPAAALLAVGQGGATRVAAATVQSLGLLLITVVLVYLYKATRHRRPETPRGTLVLIVLGPVLVTAMGIALQVALLDAAREFVASGPRTAARASAITREGVLPVIREVSLGASIALGLGIVLLSVNAMRAGLLSRFMGILGMLAGVLAGLPISAPPTLLFFWVAALGLLALGRWPGGRGPAWETGEAAPWPSPAEQRRVRDEEAAEEEPPPALDTAEDGAGADPPASGTGGRPRKRKRRR